MESFSPNLNKKSEIPLYMQLYTYILEELKKGNLKNGEKLPSKRLLSKNLGISLNTINTAYQMLISEGYVVSKERSGLFVSNFEINSESGENKELKEIFSENKDSYQFDFGTGSIDTLSFPTSVWNKLYRQTLSSSSELLNLGRLKGEMNLCEEIARYLYQYRGVNCTADQVIIGSGIENLISMLSNLFNNSTFALENPGYNKIPTILENQNIPIKYVNIDDNGMKEKDLEESDANICYLTPSHQFPSGITMPIKRRYEILNWANNEDDRYIIEDDYDSEFRFDRLPIPSLQSLDNNEKVIYMSTFSRSLAPGIRIAYMVLPKKLIPIFDEKFKYYSSTVSRFEQNTLAAFLNGGYYSRHLNRLRKRYRESRNLIIKEFKKNFPGKVNFYGEHTGIHLVVTLDLDRSEEELIEIAKENGIKITGFHHYLSDNKIKLSKPTFVIGYGNLKEETIREGIKKLKEIWN